MTSNSDWAREGPRHEIGEPDRRKPPLCPRDHGAPPFDLSDEGIGTWDEERMSFCFDFVL